MSIKTRKDIDRIIENVLKLEKIESYAWYYGRFSNEKKFKRPYLRRFGKISLENRELIRFTGSFLGFREVSITIPISSIIKVGVVSTLLYISVKEGNLTLYHVFEIGEKFFVGIRATPHAATTWKLLIEKLTKGDLQ